MSRTLCVRRSSCSHIVCDTIHLPRYQRTCIFQVFQLCVSHVLCALQIIFSYSVSDSRYNGYGVLVLLRLACERFIIRNGYVQRVNYLRLRSERRKYLHAIRRALDPVRGVQCNRQVRTVDRTLAALNKVACAAYVRCNQFHAQAVQYLSRKRCFAGTISVVHLCIKCQRHLQRHRCQRQRFINWFHNYIIIIR